MRIEKHRDQAWVIGDDCQLACIPMQTGVAIAVQAAGGGVSVEMTVDEWVQFCKATFEMLGLPNATCGCAAGEILADEPDVYTMDDGEGGEWDSNVIILDELPDWLAEEQLNHLAECIRNHTGVATRELSSAWHGRMSGVGAGLCKQFFFHLESLGHGRMFARCYHAKCEDDCAVREFWFDEGEVELPFVCGNCDLDIIDWSELYVDSILNLKNRGRVELGLKREVKDA